MTETLFAEDVAALSRPQREARVRQLVNQAHTLVDDIIREHVTDAGKQLAGIVVLFSGGNDSTVLAHLMRHRATHVGMANTGIGVEATRQFVRDTAAAWGLPLIEKHPPPGSTYRELVVDQGFPGPAHHWKVYQRLKERCFRQIRAELVADPRRQRVVFLAGRRRDESERRADVPESERQGSTVWGSPLVDWTKLDLNTYRLMHGDLPTNLVTALFHMSAECLCGSYAAPGEREEIAELFPEVESEIVEHEAAVRAAGHPDSVCTWGWAAQLTTAERRTVMQKVRQHRGLCSACDARQLALFGEASVA